MARGCAGPAIAANPDLLGLAFMRLAARDVASCSLVCKRFHACAQSAMAVRFLGAELQPTRLALPEHALSMHITHPFHGGQDLACKHILVLLLGARRLQDLRLQGRLLSDRHVLAVSTATSKLVGLTHLSLHCTLLHAAATALARALPRLTALEELSLVGSLLGDAGLALLLPSFRQLPRLRHLDVAGNALTASACTTLADLCTGCPALTSLVLNDEGLELPSNILPVAPALGRALIKLQASVLDPVDQTILPATLRALPRLQNLYLTESELFTVEVCCEALSAIRHLTDLRHLKIMISSSAGTADDSLFIPALQETLPLLPKLQFLHVQCFDVDDGDMHVLTAAISALRNLTHLGLLLHNGDVVRGDAEDWAVMLRGCSRLRSLEVSLGSSFPWQQLHVLVPELTRLEFFSGSSTILVPEPGATVLTALKEVGLSVLCAPSASAMQLMAQLLSGGAVTCLAFFGAQATRAYRDDWGAISQTLGALTRLQELQIDADSSNALGFFLHGEFDRWQLTQLTNFRLGCWALPDNMKQLQAEMAAHVLPRLPNLHTLTVECGTLRALRQFAAGLRHLTLLTTLELDGWMADEGGEQPLPGQLPAAPDCAPSALTEAQAAAPGANWFSSDLQDPSDDFALALAGLTRLQVLALNRVGTVAWTGGLVFLRRLTCLQLVCMRVHRVAAVWLAGVLGQLPQLGALRLDHSQIDGGVSEALARGLRGLDSLQHLSLRCLGLGPGLPRDLKDEGGGLGECLDASMQQVAGVLEHITGLCVLELHGTGAGERHLQVLAERIAGTDRVIDMDLEAVNGSVCCAAQFRWRPRCWFHTMWQKTVVPREYDLRAA